jgi:hypothetical protein
MSRLRLNLLLLLLLVVVVVVLVVVLLLASIVGAAPLAAIVARSLASAPGVCVGSHAVASKARPRVWMPANPSVEMLPSTAAAIRTLLLPLPPSAPPTTPPPHLLVRGVLYHSPKHGQQLCRFLVCHAHVVQQKRPQG